MNLGLIEVSLIGMPIIKFADHRSVRLERKASALLFLAARRPATSRAAAAAMLWPDVGTSTARTNLRVTTHRLHRAVGCTLFQDSDVLELIACEDDVSRCLHQTLTPAAAFELLSKPLLDGFQFDDCPDISLLLEQTQNALYDHAEREIHRHGQELAAAGTVEATDLSFLFKTLAIRPLAERVASGLMEALLRLGDRAGGLAIYERLRSSMIQQLGVSPSSQTQRVHAQLLQASPANFRQGEQSPARSDDRFEFRLVERALLLERLWQSAASGQYILIEGEAGIGKSRLIREFSRAYRKVCFVRLQVGNEQQSYSLMRQLVFQLRDMVNLTQFPPVLRYFARTNVGKSRDRDSLGAVEEIATALLQTLVNARQAGLEILVIDDCHEVDASSAAILVKLLSALEHPRRDVGEEIPSLVFTGRGDGPNRVLTRLLNCCRGSNCCCHIQLESLTATGIAEMMDQLGITSKQLGLTYEELQNRTGGNPFFVTELLREACWGEALTSKRIPSAVSALFRQRISTLSDESFFLLEVGCCAGSDFEPAMVEEMREWGPVGLSRAWSELRHVGIFGSAGFAHDLARAATEAELSGPARIELHQKIAQYLQPYALPERIAHHLILGGRNAEALPHAVTAARRLMLEYSFRETLALLERALQKETFDEALHIRSARFAATCLLAHCLSVLDGSREAISSMVTGLVRLATSPTEELIAECWVAQSLVEGSMPSGAAALAKRDRLDGDSVWNWSLQIMHCYARVALQKLDEAARILPRPPVQSDAACWEFGLHSFGKYTLCLIGLGLLTRADDFQSSHVLPDRMSYFRCAMRSSIADERGDLHLAAYWRRELLAGFAQSHQDIPPYRVALNILWLAMCEIRRGNTSEARELFESIEEDGSAGFRNDTLLVQALLSATEGDDIGYRRAMAGAQLDGDPDLFLYIYWIEIRRTLKDGDADRAADLYFEGLQKICGLYSPSCNAFRLLGGRFDEPAAAIASAEKVLDSPYNQERLGLLALAQLEIAHAALRLNNIDRAQKALLGMHKLPFLGFSYILLPDEFLHATMDAVKQCKRNALTEFAARLQGLIVFGRDKNPAQHAGLPQQASPNRPLARA